MRLLFFLLFVSVSVYAQDITRVEYFFDTDPGFGNGISIPITSAPDLSRDFTVPLNTVGNGFHKFYIRAKSNIANWSFPQSQPVFVFNNTVTFITQLEYFFDVDPGFGNGISIPITAAVDLSRDFTIPLSTVSSGFHTMNLRAKNISGQWSLLLSRTVFVQVNTQSTVPFPLKKIEYFLDSDPGFGNANSLPASTIQVDQMVVADLSLTSPGFHVLYLRSQDINNQWSLPFAKPFFVAKSGSNIVALEYYYTDGTTQSSIRVYNSFTPGKDLTLDFGAVLDGLAPNTSYQIHVTAINADGQRSDETIHTFVTPAIICDPISTPTTTEASRCGSGSVVLTAMGATGIQTYSWYQVPTGGIAIAGETGGTYTTPVLNDTTTYYVAIKNGTCESVRTPVTAYINSIPSQPSATNNSACGSSTVMLSASGGINGQYRWYSTPSGGTPLSGEMNSSYVTPSLSSSTTYYVSLNNGVCESVRTPVTATINAIPSQPILTSSIALIGNALTICSSTILTLSAPIGFATYAWSNGATTQQITTSISGSYSVIVTDAAGCSSPPSEVINITVIPAPCNNQPPVISTTTTSIVIGGLVTINLLNLISDVDNNLDVSSLRIVQQPNSGVAATLVNGTLTIDYSTIAFEGKDQVTIEVCDIFSACAQRIFEIDVIGDIEIYNALSPNGDDQNEIFLIRYIDLLPETQNNTVAIYNRWGSKVFEVENYNNTTNVFKGLNDNGNELPSGTYFYRIKFLEAQSTPRKTSGYLVLKR